MRIPDIHIRKVDYSNTKGYASITIDNEIVIHDIKILEKEDRLFIAMPSRRRKDGSFVDVAHPISQKIRDMMCDAILDAYNNVE